MLITNKHYLKLDSGREIGGRNYQLFSLLVIVGNKWVVAQKKSEFEVLYESTSKVACGAGRDQASLQRAPSFL